jgi:carbamoyl-phosphate synthase small subunit
MRQLALLVLADGTVFEGEAIGALAEGRDGEGPRSIATGEIVFNTCLSGYQEVLTDPSYAGQVIAFTYPHIGNYGVSPEDEQSWYPFCRGVVVRDITDRPSSWRSAESLERFLVRHEIAGITGVDTRRLTRHIREAGAMPCALGTAPEAMLLEAARREPGTEGVDLVELHGALAGERAQGRRLRLRHQDDHPPEPRSGRKRRGGTRHDPGE